MSRAHVEFPPRVLIRGLDMERRPSGPKRDLALRTLMIGPDDSRASTGGCTGDVLLIRAIRRVSRPPAILHDRHEQSNSSYATQQLSRVVRAIY